MNAISAENISRTFKIAEQKKEFWTHLINRKYKILEAVRKISFNINKGELIGFIGPNGAGKSTTIKMMSGILVPTSGKISVLGKDPHKYRKENAYKIGVVFGQRSQLWWDLPVYDTFQLLKKMYKVPDSIFEENMKNFDKRLDLKSFYLQPVRQLSLGQRMRADVAASLLHNPEILFLDEPTIGLDVVVKQQIRDFICEINKKRNTTIVLTTHDMRDIEEICKRIIMIDKGVIVLDTSVYDIKGKLGGASSIIVDFAELPDDINIPNVRLTKRDGLRWTFVFETEQVKSGEIISKIASKYKIYDVSVKEKNIEDIIREIYLNHLKIEY